MVDNCKIYQENLFLPNYGQNEPKMVKNQGLLKVSLKNLSSRFSRFDVK